MIRFSPRYDNVKMFFFSSNPGLSLNAQSTSTYCSAVSLYQGPVANDNLISGYVTDRPGAYNFVHSLNSCSNNLQVLTWTNVPASGTESRTLFFGIYALGLTQVFNGTRTVGTPDLSRSGATSVLLNIPTRKRITADRADGYLSPDMLSLLLMIWLLFEGNGPISNCF